MAGREEFQPTRPVRGATGVAEGNDKTDEEYFNPRAPCGARHNLPDDRYSNKEISTHAPRAGRDRALRELRERDGRFQPTRPVRGATGVNVNGSLIMSISTHAPRAGRDAIRMA